MFWRELTKRSDDCYFCLVNVKRFNNKNKQHLQYPSLSSTTRPFAYSEEISVSKFTGLSKIHDTHLSSTSYKKKRTNVFSHLMKTVKKNLYLSNLN